MLHCPSVLLVSFTVKPHASKICFLPTVQWGHLSQGELELQMNLLCKKPPNWVILILRQIMLKKGGGHKTSSSVRRTAGSRKLWDVKTSQCPHTANWFMWLMVTSDLHRDGSAVFTERRVTDTAEGWAWVQSLLKGLLLSPKPPLRT